MGGPVPSPAPRRSGGRDVCEFTASERPEQLAAWARQGRPVFLEQSFVPQPALVEQLSQQGCRVLEDPRCSWLGRVTP